MPLKEGTRVGPYEIGPLLGAGGMGEVYRARDTRLDRDAALRKALFKVGFIPSPIYDDYRLAPDGRFLIKAPVGSEAIRVIVNWSALLKKNE